MNIRLVTEDRRVLSGFPSIAVPMADLVEGP